MTAQTLVKTYKKPKQYQKDATKLSKHGRSVVSTATQTRRSFWTGWLFANSKIIVTYSRTG